MSLEITTPSIRHQVRALPKLRIREKYIQRIAWLHALYPDSFERAKRWHEERKKIAAELRRKNLPFRWIVSWDRQVRSLLRKGYSPQKISNLMAAQAYTRKYGAPVA